jgi:hypothetical protein
MIYNASGRIAVKCSQCGKYKIFDINLFTIKDKKVFKCSCGEEILKMHINRGELVMEIPCIACEIQHSYRFKLKDLMNKPIDIASCPVTGIEIAFLGRKKNVDDFVIRHIKDMNELLKFLGIEEERTRKIVK